MAEIVNVQIGRCDIRGGGIEFSSGRVLRVNAGIVGLSPELEPHDGYDSQINWPVPDWDDYTPQEERLTADDMRELADMMIERWMKFKGTL